MNNIIPILKYIMVILKHKWFVLIAGLKTGAPIWHLIIHDWTKFLPSELPHYGRQFYGDKSNPKNWETAWIHHQNHNPHHWEYWFDRSKILEQMNKHQYFPIQMPEWAIREMIADYMAAGRAYEGKWPDIHNWDWMIKNCGKLHIDWSTRFIMSTILEEMGVEKTNAQWQTGII